MRLRALLIAALSVGAVSASTTFATSPPLVSGQLFTSGLDERDAGSVVVEDSQGRLLVGGSVRDTNVTTQWAMTRFLSDGSLDTSFGTGGLVTTAAMTTGTNVIETMAIDSTDRVIASGRSATGDIVVRRYLASGALDQTFAAAGTFQLDLTATETGEVVALDSLGRIVIAAQLNRGFPDADVVVVRLTADGQLDTSFNTTGWVITDVGTVLGGAPSYDVALDMTLDATDRPIVGGMSPNGQWLLMRYTTAGVLDTAFGVDGIRRIDYTNQTDYVRWVDTMADGRIVAGGYYGSGGGQTSGLERFVVARFNADGSDDMTYGTNGLASLDVGAAVREVPSTWTLAADGSVTVSGFIMNHGVSHNAVLVTFDPGGNLDTSIAADGLQYLVAADNFVPSSRVSTASGLVFAGSTDPLRNGDTDMAIHLVPSGAPNPNNGQSQQSGAVIPPPPPATTTAPTTTTPTTTPPPTTTAPTTTTAPSNGTEPQLVTPADAAGLAQPPGAVMAMVDGEPVPAEVVRVDIPAAAVPPQQRSAEDVAQLRVAASELVAGFNDDTSQITVVDTDTGAAIGGLLTDPTNPTLGVPVPVEDALLIVASDTRVLLAGADEQGRPVPTPTGILDVTDGGLVAAAAAGFDAGTPGEVVLLSTPRLVGSFVTGALGDHQGQYELPPGMEPGYHTLVMTTGNRTVALGLRVTGNQPTPGTVTLPATGTSTPLWWIPVLIIAGLAVLITRWRVARRVAR
jgi:uncharacterized delta-60 repeat protein